MASKILVVDDNIPSAQSLAWAVQTLGYDVRYVADGETALKETETFVPDIVLCDINMPGMLGYEVCQKLRADERLKQTLFLAQTALSTHELKQKSLEAGFHYHLVKPVDLDKLFDIIALDEAQKNEAKKTG